MRTGVIGINGLTLYYLQCGRYSRHLQVFPLWKLGGKSKHQQKQSTVHYGPESKTPCCHGVMLSNENLLQAQEHHQRVYNRDTRLRQFAPGDKVLLVARTIRGHMASGGRWQWGGVGAGKRPGLIPVGLCGRCSILSYLIWRSFSASGLRQKEQSSKIPVIDAGVGDVITLMIFDPCLLGP